MSDPQATRFASDYTIVDQYTDSSTGLSATVFMNNQTGTFNLAIRGTTDILDLLADAQLLLGGAARAQIVSLYNYVQRLITPAGQSALQVQDVAPDIDPITGYINDPGGIRTTTSATGLGYLAGASGVTVTGHSLGGHLAAAASRLFPGLISSTDTYNAPGFSLPYADALLDQFPTDAGVFPAGITNLVAETGATIIPNVGSLPGTPQNIYIEDQGTGIPGNHGIIPLTDALALYNLFAQLDPALNNNPATGVPQITDILKAAAGTPGKSLENSLDALRTLFQQNYANSTANGNAAPTFVNDRNDFYTKLYGLETYLKNSPFYNTTTQSLGFTVEKLTNMGSGTLVANAQADIAYRYALYKLNPFAVTNAGSLYSTINGDQSLDLYSGSARTGTLTDEYLKDRASFLYNKIQANNQDHDITADGSTLATTWVKHAGQLQYFEDNGNYLPYKLYLGPDSSIVTQPTSGLNQIKFGSVNTDTLTGGDTWDKLYGMAGDDTLQGKKGNDYLEGGAGDDTYTYISGDGLDTILDTDGSGKIRFDGTILTGGDKLFGETYKSSDGKYLYTLLQKASGQDLLISGIGGQIIVKDFQSGELGITLSGGTAPAPTSEFHGTANNDADLIDSGVPIGVAGGGVLDANWSGYAAYGQTVNPYTEGSVGAMYFLSRFGQPYPENTIFDALYGEGGDALRRSSSNKIRRILQTIRRKPRAPLAGLPLTA